MSGQLHIRTLGGLIIQHNDEPITQFDQRKVPALLAYLACTGRPQPREVLAELFWEDRSQSQSLANLRVALSNLRKIVGSFVEITRETASMSGDGWWLDTHAFERYLHEADDDPARLSDAIDYYQGDFLEGFYIDSQSFEDWALLERERLRFLAIEALDRLIGHLLADGDYARGVTQAARLLQIDPLREKSHRQLIDLFSRSGHRAAALNQYETYCQLLYEELGVEPAMPTVALYERIRDGGQLVETEPAEPPRQKPLPLSVPATSESDLHNLPTPPTSFIGREQEIEAIAHQLQQPSCRLLTLVGPGGCGKTRLAIEVARQVDFREGVYFVPLQSLRASENIITTLIDILPLQLSGDETPKQQLLNYLRDKHMLLVLDNFEHLLDGVDTVVHILGHAQNVKLLVTSRERLNLQREYAWPVLGLAVPQSDQALGEAQSAVQLFTERARRIQPQFSLEAEKDAVIRICRLVDGLPLALELAATWVRAMPCVTIADEIRRNIDILTSNQYDLPERHQSMRAVFEHSWRLLNESEQLIFSKLTVFRGGFTANAADYVAGASLHTLVALLDKSLIQRTAHGRYDLHELVRQFAEEQLEMAGRIETTLDAHAEYYTQFSHECENGLTGSSAVEVLQTMAIDFENIRAAWLRAAERRRVDLINCAMGQLVLFCNLRDHKQEGLALMQQARSMLEQHVDTDRSPVWGRFLARYTYLEHATIPPEHKTRLYQAHLNDVRHAMAIARHHNDEWETAYCTYQQGLIELSQQNFAAALELFNQCLALFDELQDTYYMALVRMDMIYGFGMRGQTDQAREVGLQAVEVARTSGNQINLVNALANVAWGPLYAQGDLDEARRLYDEILTLAQEIGVGETLNAARFHMAVLAFFEGNFEEIASLSNELMVVARKHYAHHENAGASNVALGLAASLQENYPQAMHYGLRGSAKLSDIPHWHYLADLVISIAACGLGEIQVLRNHVLALLKFAAQSQRLMFMLSSLPCTTIYLARIDQPERAVETLALVWTHPKAPLNWFENWSLLIDLRSELEVTLGLERYTEAWERGQQCDLLQTVRQLCADLQPDANTLDSSTG